MSLFLPVGTRVEANFENQGRLVGWYSRVAQCAFSLFQLLSTSVGLVGGCFGTDRHDCADAAKFLWWTTFGSHTGQWFVGVITKFHEETNAYDVEYDDGDLESGMSSLCLTRSLSNWSSPPKNNKFINNIIIVGMMVVRHGRGFVERHVSVSFMDVFACLHAICVDLGIPRSDLRILDESDDATKSIFHRLPVPGEWVSVAHILLQHTAVDPSKLYARCVRACVRVGGPACVDECTINCFVK